MSLIMPVRPARRPDRTCAHQKAGIADMIGQHRPEDRMTEHPENIVVIGGGLAAAKGVEALRDSGFDGSLTVIAAEDELPYERPPLSKGYLTGAAPFADAIVHSAEWYSEHDVDLRLGVRATGLDISA